MSDESGRVYDRETTGMALARVYPPGPIIALLVPEIEFVALVLTARELVFNDDRTRTPALLHALDQTSEPFADMLDLPFNEMTKRRAALCEAAGHVLNWLNAGCITIPPVPAIRALAETLR